jgi:hypothetical protein
MYRLPHLPHRASEGSSAEQPTARKLRARAWLHQCELDHELACGADLHQSPEIEVRSQQLLSGQFRRHLVAEIDCVLAKAERAPHWRSASLPVQTAAVSRARGDFVALRQALLASSPAPSVRGVAQATCLLNDPEGPVFRHVSGVKLADLVNLATDACAQDDGTATAWASAYRPLA